jgi:chromosome segregation ATPase
MIKKEIKEYKRGNSHTYRINIAKQDNLTGEVYILPPNEYTSLKKEIKTLNEKIAKQNKELAQLYERINKIDENEQTIKEIVELHDEAIKELDQQHIDQLKESYEHFNKEITKYITANQLQNTALKQILELGFIDIIKNKHKQIAKDQIKELDKKPVYELTKNRL